MFRVAVRIIMLYTDTCIIDVILQHCMLVFIFNLLCLIAHVVMTYGRQIVHMCVCVCVCVCYSDFSNTTETKHECSKGTA